MSHIPVKYLRSIDAKIEWTAARAKLKKAPQSIENFLFAKVSPHHEFFYSCCWTLSFIKVSNYLFIIQTQRLYIYPSCALPSYFDQNWLVFVFPCTFPSRPTFSLPFGLSGESNAHRMLCTKIEWMNGWLPSGKDQSVFRNVRTILTTRVKRPCFHTKLNFIWELRVNKYVTVLFSRKKLWWTPQNNSDRANFWKCRKQCGHRSKLSPACHDEHAFLEARITHGAFRARKLPKKWEVPASTLEWIFNFRNWTDFVVGDSCNRASKEESLQLVATDASFVALIFRAAVSSLVASEEEAAAGTCVF